MAGDAGPEMGCGSRRLRRRWRGLRRQLRCDGGVSTVVPVDLVIRGCPPTPKQLLQGLLSLLKTAPQPD